MVISPREKLRAEQTHKIISFFAKSGIFHFLSVSNKITHLFSVQEVHITAQAMFGRLFKSFVIFWEPFLNPEKHTSICFILVTVLTEYLDGADMLNLALCLSSVSAPGMYLANPYQTGVCISPTKILHQAASSSAVCVSHQAEYCTKHYPPMVCISQALSAPPATAITPSEDQHHPWGLSWTGVFWQSEEERDVLSGYCILMY